MRRIRLILCLVAGVGLGGCITPSLHGLYEGAKDLMTDNRLVGTWSGPGGYWIIRNMGSGHYYVIREWRDERTAYDAALTRLGRQTFLDLEPEEAPAWPDKYAYHLVRCHTLSRVQFVGDTLKLMMLDLATPDSTSRAARDTLPYEYEVDAVETSALVTASTSQLRAFLAKHSNDRRHWSPCNFVRVR
jgi:hypothetical protein